MTEQEWLECTDPTPMLAFLRWKASQRKFSLFICACCRRIWPFLTNEAMRFATEIIERYADRVSTQDLNVAHAIKAGAMQNAVEILELNADDSTQAGIEAVRRSGNEIHEVAYLYRHFHTLDGDHKAHDENLFVYATIAMSECGSKCLADNLPPGGQIAARIARLFIYPHDEQIYGAERKHQSDILRDIFGNPFRPVTIDPRWLTSTVVDLSHAIYDERAFDRMPILADALMDAGCDNETLIAHCRSEATHVRGCWVVDLILSKDC